MASRDRRDSNAPTKRQQDNIRLTITRNAARVVGRLIKHVMGELDLTATQIKAAEILLRKSIPDLAQVEYTGEAFAQYVVRLPQVAKDADEWLEQNSPTLQ